MIGRVRCVLAAGLLASGTLVSCGVFPLGDEGLPIAFVNRTGESVVLYEKGRANPSYRKELAPDGRSENVWVGSRLDDKAKEEARIYRVEAVTPSGELVFCHTYTFNELTRVRWVVEIRRQSYCPP